MDDNFETGQLTKREAYRLKRQQDRLARQIAFHEAGHAVCAHLLGTEIEQIAILVEDGSGYCQLGASYPDQYVIRLYAGLIGQSFISFRAIWKRY